MDGEVQFFLEKSNRSFSQKKIKRILGLDPGLANTGFGVIDCVKGSCHLVSYGTIETKPDFSHQNRLLIIFKKLQEIIKEFKPDSASMESLFFARNVSSALNVAEAKGVVSLCLALNKIPVTEYKPNQIKQAVTGEVKADKKLVQKYTQMLLKLDNPVKPDHASDALACAITHSHFSDFNLGVKI